jgi:hypothetical protein
MVCYVRLVMSNVIELPNRGKIVVIFYEVSDTQGIAIWGGENPVEALKWYRNSPTGSKIWVSQWEADKEDAKQVLEPMEITPIVLATITDCMERWGNGKS